MTPTDSSPPGGPSSPRRYRAGESIEDYCRACHADRMHTVMAAGADGRPLRVVCGFCGSEHNFRGGPRTAVTPARGDSRGAHDARDSRESRDTRDSRPMRPAAPSSTPLSTPSSTPSSTLSATPSSWPASTSSRAAVPAVPLPLVSEWDRVAPPTSLDQNDLSLPDHAMDLELLLRRIIREESGLTPVAPAEKWRGGELVLRPGKPGVQDKVWPIDTFFHKIVMIRNRLRTLEQQLNSSDLPDDVKVRLQGYVTGCYGTLTSFNVLFADEDDQFKGSSGAE